MVSTLENFIYFESESCSVVSDSVTTWTVHGILQARILEWVAFPFSRGSSQPRDWTQVSCIAGQLLHQQSHKGSPRILEWVAYPFSSGSSWPRNRTTVSCIAGRFFRNWTMRKALIYFLTIKNQVLTWAIHNLQWNNDPKSILDKSSWKIWKA